jgi:fluoroquinolone resistance protein
MSLNTPQSEYSSQEFKKLILKSTRILQKDFVSCTFIKCNFTETIFQECRFHECKFKECDLSLASLKECAFNSTRFENSQVIGVDWTQTAWAKNKFIVFKPVDFIDCVLNHSTFSGLKMKQIQIVRCIAHDVSFEEADLTQADCTFTDFNSSRFMHTNLTEANFTSATNYSIAPQLNVLKKTKFSLPEAMALLYGLDIILSEDRSLEA